MLSISACGAQSLSISNQTSNSTGSSGSNGSRASLASNSCSGVKLCPGGSFCPSADQQMPCDPGHWCPAGSIKSQPCNITVCAVVPTVQQWVDLSVQGACVLHLPVTNEK